jgi:hypothetical protein
MSCKDREQPNSRIEIRYQMAQLISTGIEKGVIAWYMDCSTDTVERLESRLFNGELIGDRSRSGRPRILNDKLCTELISWYFNSKPLDSTGTWTIRWAEAYLANHVDMFCLSVSKSSIHRILKTHQLKPHLLKYFLHICDPDFFTKLEHIIDLYHRGLQYLFCFDECPGIQVLERHCPSQRSEHSGIVLTESHYIRNGTIDILAFLRVKTGEVFQRTTLDHRGRTFCRVFREHVEAQPDNEQLHYLMDNHSTHSTEEFCRLVAKLCRHPYPSLKTAQQRREWLKREDKRIVVHFTPFHGSWLNMVEIWFGIMRPKCLNNEIFHSKEKATEAVARFTDEVWNEYLTHEFVWKYNGEGLKESVVRRITTVFNNHHTELSIQHLTKLMLLISNMACMYWSVVSIELWTTLFKVIELRREYFTECINKETRTIIKKRAENAMKKLLSSISTWPILKNKAV